MSDTIVYGPGGFSPDEPNGNITERITDNGDGTGTRTTYAPDGTITNTETVVIPDPTPEPPDRLTELEDMVRAQAAIIDDLLDALGGDDGSED